MVRALLGLVLGGLLVSGCLLSNPPDYDDSDDHWPVFVSVLPPGTLVEVNQTQEGWARNLTGSFGAVVRDGNVDQAIRYRWFLDYEPPTTPGSTCGLEDRLTLEPNGLEERTVGAPVGQWHERLIAGGCHRLSLVVTDGNFEPEGCAAVTEGSHVIFRDWYLGVHSADHPFDTVDFAECLSRFTALTD